MSIPGNEFERVARMLNSDGMSQKEKNELAVKFITTSGFIQTGEVILIDGDTAWRRVAQDMMLPSNVRTDEPDLSFGVAKEDLTLWNTYIHNRRDIDVHAILKAKKYHLLTQVIGNPNDPINKTLRNHEMPYGNTLLHDRMVNTPDESVVKILRSDEINKSEYEITESKKTADFLLRTYELWVKSSKQELKNLVIKAITALDAQGKTPLLLACKALNQDYALRILALDVNKLTIELADNIEKHTPLHIACILGLEKIAEQFIQLGANKTAIDREGHTPGYYLNCSKEEIKIHIARSLESVNFFFGHYFSKKRKTEVINTVFKNNRALAKKLKAQLPSVAAKAVAAAWAAPVPTLQKSNASAATAPATQTAAAGEDLPLHSEAGAKAQSETATVLFQYSATGATTETSGAAPAALTLQKGPE